MSNITITGGSGFIGTRLVSDLLKLGHKIEIIDVRRSNRYPAFWKDVDIRDRLAVERNLPLDNIIVHLAAVHRDDVRPLSLYHETNVDGTQNVCDAARKVGTKQIIFTSSVAVYGFTEPGTAEDGLIRPFNEYGKTKYLAEEILIDWQKEEPEDRALTIVRPTVVFGEGNRGNVYNLLKQIHSGRFMMIGRGQNVKSMAYVGNVTAFLAHCVSFPPGIHLFNYVDKPDLTMNELVTLVRAKLHNRTDVGVRLPSAIRYLGGKMADVVSRITGKKLPLSTIRIKKFLSDTAFGSKVHNLPEFNAPVSLYEGIERTLEYEFIHPSSGDEVFYTE